MPPEEKIHAFFRAAEKGDDAQVTAFLNAYPYSVDIKNFLGWTALMTAISQGREKTALFLLDKGASVHEKDQAGSTALIFAVLAQQEHIVVALLEKGACPEEENNAGASALSLAKTYRYAGIIEIFKEWPQKQKKQQQADTTRALTEERLKKLKTHRPPKKNVKNPPTP